MRTNLFDWRWWAGIALLLLYQAPGLEAQTQQALSLQEAIARALRHNPRLAAAQARVEAGAERVNQARAGFLPRIDFEEGFSRTTNPMMAFGTKLNQESITPNDFDPDVLNDPDPINNFRSRVAARWTLYDRGQTWSGYQQADLDRLSLESRLARTRQEVIHQTVEAYHRLLLVQARRRLIADSLEAAAANLQLASSRFRSGMAVKSDVLLAEVRIADLRQTAIEADGRIAVARAGLNAVLGEALDPDTTLSDRLEMPQMRIQGAVAHWEQTALKERPAFRQLDLARQAAQEEIRKSQRAHLPSFGLTGDYEVNSESFDETANNYSMGAYMSFNLFSGGAVSARTREAMAALSELEALRQSLEDGVRVETCDAFYRVASAEQRIEAAAVAVDQAGEALAIVSGRYRSGLVPIASLLDAEETRHRSRFQLLEATFDYRTAAAGLLLAAGTLDQTFPY